MSADIPMCLEPSPGSTGLEPCVKEPDHQGGHYWFYQKSWGQGSNIYGIQVFTDDPRAPKMLKSVYAFEVAGSVTTEEVAALVAYMDAIKKGR